MITTADHFILPETFRIYGARLLKISFIIDGKPLWPFVSVTMSKVAKGRSRSSPGLAYRQSWVDHRLEPRIRYAYKTAAAGMRGCPVLANYRRSVQCIQAKRRTPFLELDFFLPLGSFYASGNKTVQSLSPRLPSIPAMSFACFSGPLRC